MQRLLMGQIWILASTLPLLGAETLPPAAVRFQKPTAGELPDFQRHVLTLMGRLGCNGRACHGSFQGQGGFRLSLFGYDFKADYEALTKGDSPRVDLESPESSLILEKATLGVPHKGGKRMEVDSWQYRMMLQWIQNGAKPASMKAKFVRLDVTPSEIVFQKAGEKVQLKAVVHWSDGTSEDITCLCRFRTNDEAIAEISEDGVVTSLGKGDTHVVAFYDNGVTVTQVMLPVSDRVGPNFPATPTPTKIDELVVAKLQKLGIVPAAVCTDEEFLRRVSLDMTGTLPTPAEIRAFVKDKSPNKRARKIDELLERPAYAAWWATRLCDWTGNNERNQSEQSFRRQMAQQWYEWIHKRVAENVPYDELVAGIVLANGRSTGESFDRYSEALSDCVQAGDGVGDFADRPTMPHFWARRTLRTPEEKALSVSYAFLAVRLECAQCHKHPFDQWTQQDFNQFTAFFARVNYGVAPDATKRFREMEDQLGLRQAKGGDQRRLIEKAVKDGKTVPWREVFVQPVAGGGRARTGKANNNRPGAKSAIARVLGGDEVDPAQYADPRTELMEWMRDPGNHYFAKAFVNRVWSAYFGVGIVEPPDDHNLANPPSNRALLDHLAASFVESRFDMKQLHRQIANSRTYQLSWEANETNRLDGRNFSHALIRRLPAEAAYDAVVLATASDDQRKALERDPKGRAIAQGAAGDIRRGQNSNAFALQVFGKPERTTTCDCERSNDPTLTQSIYLRNDRDIFTLIDRNDGWLAQFARSMGLQVGGKAADPNGEDRSALETRLQRQAQKLRKEGKAKEARGVEQRLVALRRGETSGSVPGNSRSSPQRRATNVDKVVEEVYLRTVCRLPNQAERARARKHLAMGSDPVSSTRDLLWAMLNTKEFIVNR